MRLFSKGVPTLGVLNRARARLSPKALFVWLMWSLCAALGRGLFSRPWLGCKRWARVRFIWTLARQTSRLVWALTAPEHGTSDTCSLIAGTIDQLSKDIVRGLFDSASQTTQNNKPQNDALPCAEPEHFSATFTCYRKRPVSHLWSRDELAAFKFFVEWIM